MGKTSFCLNYSARLNDAFTARAVLISLARPDALERIRKTETQSQTVLILDALDEDIHAFDDAAGRLRDLLDASQRFETVIVTCRSQFFEDDASIPQETGIARIVPRPGGGSPTYALLKTYILPFSKFQMHQYIRAHFPWWSLSNIRGRSIAWHLVRTIPELSVRPMLLALVPDLSREKKTISELFDLYDFMVQKWLDRESRWIDPAELLPLSRKIAVYATRQKQTSGSDRLDPSELRNEFRGSSASQIDWRNLTTRSLLNRDSIGRLKFAHRSIMEFLVVKEALSSPETVSGLRWTDFMEDALVSFGYSEAGTSTNAQGAAVKLLEHCRESGEAFPLVERLPQPTDVTRDVLMLDIQRAVHGWRRRPLPGRWRAAALSWNRRRGVLYLKDAERGLAWRIVDPRTSIEEGELELYRVKASDISSRRHASEYRLPSFSEFLSLLHAQHVTKVDAIKQYEFYWLGDRFRQGEYLIASLDRELSGDGIFPLLIRDRLSGLDETVNVYGLDVRRSPLKLGKLKALELQVKGL
ncbi:MAG TPA: hypothetical protein VEX35_05605 [Allosphingosinicella sp.]|nr:hypothetical protein [Allosphingosinicella sp.]